MSKTNLDMPKACCDSCGKVIYYYNRGEWAYKRNVNGRTKLFCKWSCMRAYDKKHPGRENVITRELMEV